MANENFSPAQSLSIIQSMIDKTKEDLGGNSIYFLLWGWLVFIGCLLQYFLMVIVKYPQHYQAWFIIVIGVVFSIVYSAKGNSKQRVKTYIGESMSALWMGLSIGFTALIFIMTKVGWQYAFPFYILFYGVGTFISGGLLKFKPLQWGGGACFLLSVLATHVSYPNQILMTALAIMISYLIPGYLLKNNYSKKTAATS